MGRAAFTWPPLHLVADANLSATFNKHAINLLINRARNPNSKKLFNLFHFFFLISMFRDRSWITCNVIKITFTVLVVIWRNKNEWTALKAFYKSSFWDKTIRWSARPQNQGNWQRQCAIESLVANLWTNIRNLDFKRCQWNCQNIFTWTQFKIEWIWFRFDWSASSTSDVEAGDL